MTAAAKAGKVLLVEDDPAIREEVVEFLGEYGYDVVTAKNGSDALRRLREGGERPAVILLDLMMPVMDGWTFRARQIEETGLADIPVVIISGSNNVPGDAARLRASGYLTKPFTGDSLLAAVQPFAAPTT